MAGIQVDLTGMVFHRLTVLRFNGQNSRGQSMWDCVCSCGKTTITNGYAMSSGQTKSCGCYKREVTSMVKRKHGMGKIGEHRVYAIWAGIITRCKNPKRRGYKNYGGRGITVCDEWLDFSKFYSDMGDPPDGLQIDRIDNDKGYDKENCRWVSAKANCLNRRSTRRVEWEGRVQNVVDLLVRYGVDSQTYDARKRKGWSVEDCLLTKPYGVRPSQQERSSA